MIKSTPTEHESFIQPVRIILGEQSGIATPQVINKSWGKEYIYANDFYCMKMLVIDKNQTTSTHLHLAKHETIVCIAGLLGIEWLDEETNKHTETLEPGEAFTISPGLPHRLFSIHKETRLIESSTPDLPGDSIRVSKEQ